MKNLVEMSLPDVHILNESKNEKGKILRVECKWQHCDILNSNKRRYRREILEREIDRLSPKIQNGEVTGASYHPESWGKTDDVSHIFEKIWMNKTGECFAHVKIIPTSNGKNVMTIIENGGRLGCSSRGVGTVTEKQEVINGINETFDDVNDDYKLIAPFDWVISGSVGGAGLTKILEQRMNGNIEPKNLDEVYSLYANLVHYGGLKISFKDFRNKFFK